MKRRPIAIWSSLFTAISIASLPTGATAYANHGAESVAPEQPGPPTPAEEDPLPQPPAPEGPAAVTESTALVRDGAGPVVHVVNEIPDDDRGVIKLVRHLGVTTETGANIIVLTTNYEEICTEPCGVAVDTSDRPIFFFIRDQNPVSYGFRLKGDEEVTLSLRPLRTGMRTGGRLLTIFMILPAGIPLLLLGRPKVSIAPGPPSAGQEFRKLKKAKQ